jgi:hypothetical protein
LKKGKGIMLPDRHLTVQTDTDDKAEPTPTSVVDISRFGDMVLPEDYRLIPFVMGNLVIGVPKKFTVEAQFEDQLTQRVIQFPVTDDAGEIFDAKLLLKGLDHRSMSGSTLTVNQELFTQKQAFFAKMSGEHRTLLGSNPVADDFVKKHATDVSLYSEAQEIAVLGHARQIEIKQEASDLIPSIAVEKDPKFGPLHKAKMFQTSLQISGYQAIMTLFSGAVPAVSVMDCIMVPIYGILGARVHPTPPNKREALTSMNHMSLPTALLYTATGAGTYAVNYGLKAVVTSAMTNAGCASAGITTVSFLLPVAFLVGTVVAYKYAPQAVDSVKRNVSACAYSVSSLLSACGSRLWNTCCPTKKAESEEAKVEARTSMRQPFLSGAGSA